MNLAAQLPDDWSGMMGRTSLQEDFGAYRFQLAYMAMALALAHVHRLPAAPGYFRRPFQRLIEKMRSPDVWTYWHYVSTGNGPLNKALGELPAEWNPVLKDNIMYSAYLQTMALLYHHLFDDDRYSAKNALSLTLKPLYWGSEQQFECDETALSERIYWSMVERGYLGIACEPNCIFQICNQVPIIGFRLHDIVHGSDMALEVTTGYLRAWEQFGVLNANGHYNMMVMEEEKVVVPQESPWNDFWLGSLMHAWNPKLIEANFPSQFARWSRTGPDNTLWIAPAASMTEDNSRASARDLGWAAVCASEVGDTVAAGRLLAYADRYLHSCWERGAYYYRRHDELFDNAGRFSCMDPHTGNALLGYARLNVPSGLKKIYDGALRAEHFSEPALDDLPDDWDVTLAHYNARTRSLALALAPAMVTTEASRLVKLTIKNVCALGNWNLYANAECVAEGDRSGCKHHAEGIQVCRTQEGKLEVQLPPDQRDLEVRIQWQ